MHVRPQVWVGVVPVGPKGVVLNSSYATRTSPAYMEDLGLALANWARIVPDGLLVFFASYTVLEACLRHWKSSSGSEQRGSSAVLSFHGTLWDRIVRDKQAVIEPRVSLAPLSPHLWVPRLEVNWLQMARNLHRNPSHPA